jgi:DNA-binding transcriptional ArsR family regulator
MPKLLDLVPADFIHTSAELLLALANPARLQILDLLNSGEVSVGTLTHQVGLSQSATSQHLAKLRSARLVHTRRDAQNVYYSSNSDAVAKILHVLGEIFEDDAAAAMVA